MRLQLMALLTAGSLLLANPGLQAQIQMPLASSSGGFNALLAKFFGANKAFSAQAEALVRAKAARETSTIPMGFALLDGKIRMELDLTRIKSARRRPSR